MQSTDKLSEHFTYGEITRTSKTGLDNTPSADHLQNLRSLCMLLESIRALLGVALRVNSAFRSLAVNTAIGGAKHSQHMKGQAADVVPVGLDAEEAMRRIYKANLQGAIQNIGQVIIYKSGFIHISILGGRSESEFLRSAANGGSGGPYSLYKP